MSIYGLARAASNLFLLITHNFQVVWPTQRLAPHGVCSEGCCDCLLFIYPTPPLPTFTSPPTQFSMNNQTEPKKPALLVRSVTNTHTEDANRIQCAFCILANICAQKAHLYQMSTNTKQPHTQTIHCIIKHKYE